MELVEWNDSLSVGDPLMDAHHRVFFEMIREFSEYQEKDNRDAVRDRIEFLFEYAAMHLSAEEKLMHKVNYPGLAAHKAEHDVFIHELLIIKIDFDKDSSSVSGETVLKIMQDWLVNHIVVSDKHYAPYLQSLQAQFCSLSGFD